MGRYRRFRGDERENIHHGGHGETWRIVKTALVSRLAMCMRPFLIILKRAVDRTDYFETIEARVGESGATLAPGGGSGLANHLQ